MSSNGGRNAKYLTDLNHDVHRHATLRADRTGFTVLVPCPSCPYPVEAFTMRGKMPTDQIANYMKRNGWTFDGNKKAVCPNHSIKLKPPVEEPMNDPVLNVIHAQNQAASDKAKRAKRETVALLEDVFDVPKGCFRAGESDESVGRLSGWHRKRSRRSARNFSARSNARQSSTRFSPRKPI